jgi:hypothetical protein
MFPKEIVLKGADWIQLAQGEGSCENGNEHFRFYKIRHIGLTCK